MQGMRKSYLRIVSPLYGSQGLRDGTSGTSAWLREEAGGRACELLQCSISKNCLPSETCVVRDEAEVAIDVLRADKSSP